MKTRMHFIFPVFIILIGLIIYKFVGYEVSTYMILINVVLAYILSPKIKVVGKQHGEEEQLKWLFFKKVINKKL